MTRLYRLVQDILSSCGVQEGKEAYVIVHNPPYMDLVIERHIAAGHEYLYVGHYFEQNGDRVPDPDVLFVDGKPVELRQTLWSFEVTPQNRENIESFLNWWAKNIVYQGFLDNLPMNAEVK